MSNWRRKRIVEKVSEKKWFRIEKKLEKINKHFGRALQT